MHGAELLPESTRNNVALIKVVITARSGALRASSQLGWLHRELLLLLSPRRENIDHVCTRFSTHTGLSLALYVAYGCVSCVQTQLTNIYRRTSKLNHRLFYFEN